MDAIETIRKHILRGDCYELNYCMEFFAEDVKLDPLYCYQSLTTISPNPFSAFYKVNNSYLLCASPERFLRKEENKLISQPIKGTIKRNTTDAADDELLKQQLYKSEKDRSENVMVVDLVRNDLSRVCKEGSVQVDELFGIYSFPQLYQMISTISGEVNETLSFTDVLCATFPMGSMTGAPKRKVMQLIEQYEQSRRGLFSGAVGYISPTDDFDFNVVIRSIFYNAATNYLSYMVGSGITYYSNAEQEYEECLLKADAIRKVLG
jgi:para-aminobenzoate synthetase component 1